MGYIHRARLDRNGRGTPRGGRARRTQGGIRAVLGHPAAIFGLGSGDRARCGACANRRDRSARSRRGGGRSTGRRPRATDLRTPGPPQVRRGRPGLRDRPPRLRCLRRPRSAAGERHLPSREPPVTPSPRGAGGVDTARRAAVSVGASTKTSWLGRDSSAGLLFAEKTDAHLSAEACNLVLPIPTFSSGASPPGRQAGSPERGASSLPDPHRPRDFPPPPLRATDLHTDLRPSPQASAASDRAIPAVNATHSTSPAGEACGKEEN
jgi:hypothetical protein